jgi:hypothetical protein
MFKEIQLKVQRVLEGSVQKGERNKSAPRKGSFELVALLQVN